MSRIVAAMSGGVDSSVAAALLAQEARKSADEIVGVWMRTHDGEGEGFEHKRSCCSPDAADDARRVAQLLDIPFYVLNVEREFGARVIDAFADAYLEGATPNPCQACNQYIKFDELLRRGLAVYGAEAVATGHYARIEQRDGRWRLLRAADAQKDQTYFLWVLTQEQLAATRFPLGELTKPEVRDVARSLGLVTADKPESQEICFVPGGDYRDALRTRAGWQPEAGPLLDVDGSAVGEHRGTAGYTVGQRQGLGVALGQPRYVSRIDPVSNTIQLGRREDLETHEFIVERTSFIAPAPPLSPFRAAVRIRHRAAPIGATVSPLGERRWSVLTDQPVWAAAPGQAAVFYDGDEVLGGGRIAVPTRDAGDGQPSGVEPVLAGA